jgi:DUF1009 family protein
MNRLGIIAGGGTLPRRLASAAKSRGMPVYMLGLRGQVDADTSIDASVRLGAAGRAIDLLKAEGVDTLVMAGHVRRPALSELKPDWRTLQLFARLGRRALGDDTLLRAVAQELEGEGFAVVAPHEIDPELLSPVGSLSRRLPTAEEQADIARGIDVARRLGELDVGQGVVVQQGIVLAVEAIEGTDAMLSRCQKLRRRGQGGVLVKACKPQQDKRLDLPTIGLRTLTRAYQAGLAGIAVEAGASLLLDREEVRATADRLGLFVTGFSA